MNEPAKMSKPSRLGKGLSALMGEVDSVTPAPAPTATPQANSSEEKTQGSVAEIAIDLITRNPSQPRKTFAEQDLKELAHSIKTKGVLQAILVRPDPNTPGKYQIIAGERRFRAAKGIGLKSIPAVVKEVDELELLEVGIIENVQRADLNPMEEAEAYEKLMKRFGRTQESLGASVGKSRAHIANTLRLLTLPSEAREHLRAGRITAGHARAALAAPDPDALIEEVVKKGLSVRDVEALARLAKDGVTPKSAPAAVKPKSDKDVDTQALEADLQRALGLTVDIRHSEKGGELRIKYRELEQLDDVCRRLTAKR